MPKSIFGNTNVNSEILRNPPSLGFTATTTGNTYFFSGESPNEIFRITQAGTGNSFIVEDSTNPDSSPFVIDASGNTGIGLLVPSQKLHVSGNTLINGDITVTGNRTNLRSFTGTSGSMSTSFNSPSISATTYLNLPDNVTGNYLALSGGTVTGQTFFTSGVTITGDTSIRDTSGITSLDTSIRELVSSNSQPSIDWENRQLIDENGLATLVWSSQKTLEDLFGASLDWGNKYLYKSDGSVVLDWENGIITGQTNIESSIISATTISATTLYGDGSNLTGINTQDTFLTGGTYNSSIGVATFTNNTGGTFSVTGFSTAYTYSQVNNYTANSPITITHNLNTTEILIQIIDTNTNQLILGSVSNYQLNSVDITLSSSLNGIKVVIVGGSISSVTPRGKINLLFGHDSVSPVDSTTYYIGGQFNLSPTTSASDGRRLISPVTGFITQVSISETVGGTLGSSETSTFTINNVTQSTSSTITTTATYDSSSSLINYILSSPLYVVNGDKLEIRWVTPAWVTNPTTVRQQINVLIDF